MGDDSLIIVIPFLLAALLSLGLALEAWRRARTPGSLAFALTMIAVAFWLATAAGEATAPLAASKILWSKLAYLAIAWVGPLWLLFTLEFLEPARHYARRLAAPLALIPLATIALAMTNERHGLIWSRVESVPAGEALVFHHGPWFWVFTAFSYLLLILALGLLIRGAARAPRALRGRLIALVAGMLLPWLGNVAYLTGLGPWTGLDLTPYGFALTGMIFAWVLFRTGLFDRPPLAYEAILENLCDGYIVVDERGQLLEINTAACRYLGLDRRVARGQPAETVLASWPALVELLREQRPAARELRAVYAGEEGPLPLVLDAVASPWRERGERQAGWLLILHDVTLRRQMEEDLRESEQRYRLLVEAAPLALTLLDRHGRVTYHSPPSYAIYGLQPGVDDTGESPLRWVHPEDRPLAEARLRQVSEQQASLPPEEYRLIRGDGTVFWGEVTSAAIVDPHGQTQGMLLLTRDITQHNKLQADLRKTLAHRTLVNDVLHILARPHDLRAALAAVLARAGEFLPASRVYLCGDSPDGLETTLALEWCAPGITQRSSSLPLVRYTAIPSWKQQMEALGAVVVESPETAPPDLAEFMDTWQVQSFAALPVHGSEERLYGFLAFDICSAPRRWGEEDMVLVRVLSRIVSGAVARIEYEAAEQRQRALAEALHDTASALNSTLNLDEVLDRILSNLDRVVPNAAASIAQVDKNDDGLVHFVRWRGYSPEGEELMRTMRLRVEDRETYRWMAEHRQPIIIGDTWMDKRWTVFDPYGWIRSYAGVPIAIKGRLVGFINLDSDEPDFFSEDLSYSLRVFADQAAVAIENARLYDDVQRRVEEMSILNRIGMTLTAGMGIDQLLLALFEECRRVLPIDKFYVALHDAETGEIDLPLFYNDGEFSMFGRRNIVEQPGLTGEVIRQRRTLYLPDTLDPEISQKYQYVRLEGRQARSFVGVPLINLGEVVGVLSMQNFAPHAYAPDKIRLLEMIATHAAIAVQNARLYDQMKQMTITDTVTGLFTRRHFISRGNTEVERARRYDRQLSTMMVDIDRFKRINDTYGHNIGDQVLRAVATVCRQALRATDIVGRWGGEEFAIVLPEADQEGAALIAERIRRLMTESSTTVGEHSISVTVSIGVATLTASCVSMEELIDQADRAMYLAKDSGRNQVRSFLSVAGGSGGE